MSQSHSSKPSRASHPPFTSDIPTSSTSFKPNQPIPPPGSAKLHAKHPFFSSSTTARTREPSLISTLATTTNNDAPRGKLFRITPGLEQVRVISREVLVVPDSDDDLEDTEDDERIPDLSSALGKRRSDPISSRQKVVLPHSASSSQTKTSSSTPRHAAAHNRPRSKDAHASISSGAKALNGTRSSHPSSSQQRSAGTSSAPIRLDFSEASSSESIVLLQSPPNTFRRPPPAMSSTDGKDKVERPSSSQSHKPTVPRSSAFGSHARKVNGQIIPPPNSHSNVPARDQGHGDTGRVRTVEGNDTTLSSANKHSSSSADRGSFSFGARSSLSPVKLRVKHRDEDRTPIAGPSTIRPAHPSTQKSSSRPVVDGVLDSLEAKARELFHGGQKIDPGRNSHPSFRAPQPFPMASSQPSYPSPQARPSKPIPPATSTPRPLHRSHGSSSHSAHKQSGASRHSPSTGSPRPTHASPALSTSTHSAPKRAKHAEAFPMRPSSSDSRPSIGPSASQSSPHKESSAAGSGDKSAAAHIQRLATSLRPVTPTSSSSTHADLSRPHALPTGSTPRATQGDSVPAKPSSTVTVGAKPRVHPSRPGLSDGRSKPAPLPSSSSKPVSSISARPAEPSSPHRLSVSPAKRRRETRPMEEEESYRPKKRPQTHTESPRISRPKRARPEQGRYTIPLLDAEQWPTKSGSYGATTGKRSSGQRTSKLATTSSSRPSLYAPTPSATSSSSLSSAPTTSISPIVQTRALETTSSLTILPSSSQSPSKSTKTSTPRQSHPDIRRSSTLSPPAVIEEEVEPVEKVEEEEEPIDLLADFEDFKFEPESPKTVRSLPGSQTRIPHTPEQSSYEDVFYTPKSRPSAPTPRFPSRRPADKSPLTASRKLLSPHHPTPVIISPKYLKIALASHPPAPGASKARISLDEVLAGASRKAAEEKELMQKQREERQRLMAEYTAKVEAADAEEEDEQIEDLSALPDTKDEPKPTLGKRRVPSDFDRLMREHKRNERRGVSGAQAEAILASIGESRYEGEGVPYPTPPISGDGEEGEEEDETLDDLDDKAPGSRQISGSSLRAALDNVPKGMIELDDDLVRDLAAGEDKEESEEVEQRRPVFWAEAQVRSEEEFHMPELQLDAVGPSAGLLQTLCRDQSIDTLSLCLSTGSFDGILGRSTNAQKVFDWLLQLGLGDPSGSKLDPIRSTSLYLLQKHEAVARDFLVSDRCTALFASMDINSALLPQRQGAGAEAFPVNLNRKVAAGLVCELITALPQFGAAESGNDQSGPAARGVLLLHDLAADHSTSNLLQYSARQAAQRFVSIVGKADPMAAITLWVNRSDGSTPRPLDLMDVDIQSFAGTTEKHQEVVAWTSCALLGTQMSTEHTPLPMLVDLLPLAEDIFHTLNTKRPDHIKVDRMLELFTASLGGLYEFIERCGLAYEVHTKGIDEFEVAFSQFKHRIISAMRRFPMHVAGTIERGNHARLGQLEVNLGILYKLAVSRWDRQRVARMRGLRYAEAGQKQSGQLRLDFAKR